MRKNYLMCLALFASLALLSACGGGGGGSSGSSDTASVSSLSSIPTIDLSQYDSSTSSSANLAVLQGKSLGLSKRMGDNMRKEGGSSRAGCEANMHKQEIFRHGMAAQLDRCYPEVMESLGLITIPNGSFAYYSITPPEMDDNQKQGMCDGIPAERTEERAACQSEASGKGAKAILLRLGRFSSGSELQIDMCENSSRINEATYSANGSIYTAAVTRIGNWGGEEEKAAFSATIDIGDTGSVTDGIVTMSSDGALSAQGQMQGRFGSGSLLFEKIESSNRISGAFKGEFMDPFSNTTTSFTGKVYSRFGGSTATGCAKFAFTGSMPAMPCERMIPPNIPADQRDEFLQSFGSELGVELNANTCASMKFCPNPDFNPEAPDPTIKPMTVASGNCPSVTHTGVECFGITNGTSTTDFGGTEVTQVFTKIANTASPYYDEVNAYDVSALLSDISAIAFSRPWDCSGTFAAIDFMSLPMATMEEKMSKCFALEERGRGKGGMGDYNCGQSEQMNDVNEFADEGGGQASFGKFGGEYVRQMTNCSPQPPEKLFVNIINDSQNRYCIPMDGHCYEFTVSGNSASPAGGISIGNNQRITSFTYTGDPATSVDIIINGSCNAEYNISRPEFRPREMVAGGGGGGMDFPQACKDAGMTTPQACGDYCMKPGVSCAPPSQ